MNNNLKLKYYSSGSYGVLIKDSLNNYIYKITDFTNFDYININNFNEMIYLNYFKNKYPNLYKETNNNLPIQNISTHIYIFDYFIKLYKLDDNLTNKIINKLLIKSSDLIIVNKMKFYPVNLDEFKKKDISNNNLYSCIEKIILGLHFLHMEGLAHGDLKSVNIVSDNNDYKIIDFGGIKYVSNPKYFCTCTATYRSPEDYEHEYNKTGDKSILYNECPLKSDIWSLGLVFYELINKSNPIQTKYNQFRNNEYVKNNNVDHVNIENKIHLYFKKIKTNDISSLVSLIYSNQKNNDDLSMYKLNNIIEKMLNLNPKLRVNLEDIYLSLFYQELPNLDKNKIIFSYNISSPEYYDKFINLRKKYYPVIKLNLENMNEVFLYPYISNLLDRFIIIIIDKYLSKHINFENKFNFIIDLLNYENNNPDNNNNNNPYEYNNTEEQKYHILIFNMNIFCFALYIISKLIILRKNTNVSNNIFDLADDKKNNKKISDINIFITYELIIRVLNILNFDIVRTKLFFYSTTPIELVNKFITIIDDFNIQQIINNVE